MGLMSGSVNLNNLASTTVGQNGIIQPNIHYSKDRDKKKTNLEVDGVKRPPVHQEEEASESPQQCSSCDHYPEASHPKEDWVNKQLKPLSAAYKSSWNGEGGPVELRLANGQNILPPGFINT
jgi:hypothetical protein